MPKQRPTLHRLDAPIIYVVIQFIQEKYLTQQFHNQLFSTQKLTFNKVFQHIEPKHVLCSKQTVRLAETDHVICFSFRLLR